VPSTLVTLHAAAPPAGLLEVTTLPRKKVAESALGARSFQHWTTWIA
jgi:hypothetical protein